MSDLDNEAAQRLERRIEALEELVIDELARIWNCWPGAGRGEAFNYERFESWKANVRGALRQKAQTVSVVEREDSMEPTE